MVSLPYGIRITADPGPRVRIDGVVAFSYYCQLVIMKMVPCVGEVWWLLTQNNTYSRGGSDLEMATCCSSLANGREQGSGVEGESTHLVLLIQGDEFPAVLYTGFRVCVDCGMRL